MNIYKIFTTYRQSKLLCVRTCKKCNVLFKNYHEISNLKSAPLSSKKIRQLFLDYFVHEKNHTYVQSSPVFLNSDPSLLFVNAGMNQVSANA